MNLPLKYLVLVSVMTGFAANTALAKDPPSLAEQFREKGVEGLRPISYLVPRYLEAKHRDEERISVGNYTNEAREYRRELLDWLNNLNGQRKYFYQVRTQPEKREWADGILQQFDIQIALIEKTLGIKKDHVQTAMNKEVVTNPSRSAVQKTFGFFSHHGAYTHADHEESEHPAKPTSSGNQ